MTAPLLSIAGVPPLSPMGLAALTLAQENGLAVFPLHHRRADGSCSCNSSHADTPKNIAKHPRTADGFRGATSHPEQIADWWDRWPDANIGVWPGGSQLLVLDVDGPDGAALADSLGAGDVPTLETVTRRGVHRWFRLADGVTVGNAARTQLDVRAHNGYVVAPPSVHASGFVYEWRGDFDTIADVPPAVLARLLAPPVVEAPPRPAAPWSPPGPSRYDELAERRVLAYGDRIGYGLSDGRKTAAFRFAAFMAHDVGIAERASLELLETWNASNAPPLPSRLLQEIHANAQKYGGRRGAA